MIRNTITKISFVVVLGLQSHPALANDALEAMLFKDYALLDGRCRGGSGDENETWVACGSRDYAARVLHKLGWCHGNVGETAYEMNWHLCSTSSIWSDRP